MVISNKADILALIKSSIYSDTENAKPIIDILSNNYVQDGILFFPIKITLKDYLNVQIQLSDDCSQATLSLLCANNDDSTEFKEAADIVTYLAESNVFPSYDFMPYKGGVIYYYPTFMTSIENINKTTISFISRIQSALEKYDPFKKQIDWDNIAGMEKGSVVYLTDNGRNNVVDLDGKVISAEYLGDNMLKSMNVTGSPDMLAMLLINTYGKCKAKVFCNNGNNCWVFNNKKINECEMSKKIHLPFPVKVTIEKTAKNPVKAEPATIVNMEDIGDYFDTFTITVQKYKNYDTDKPFSTVDCVAIDVTWKVDSKYTPVSYLVKKGSSFHYMPKHKCLENDKTRQNDLQKLVNADILAVKYTEDDILYTFTRNVMSTELTDITGTNYTLNKLARLIGLDISVWEKHSKYFVNKDGRHISEFYHKKYFTL